MNNATDGSTGPPQAAPVGVVLAGGESSRMGLDKARLALAGRTLAGRAAERLATVAGEVAVADGGRGLVPGVPSLPDGPGRGPAAGLLGAAAAFPGRGLLVLACDLPLVPAPLLAELARPGQDWTVPRRAGHVEPLCAFYGPAALRALAARVERGRLALHGLTEEAGLTIRFLEGGELERFGDPGEMFLNVNTPEDWERYVAISTGGPPH
ncbi:MAG: molybdenum cofactor guanylyltransferase [Thermoanaerobaculia bacterium]